jgi:hypothetical protein
MSEGRSLLGLAILGSTRTVFWTKTKNLTTRRFIALVATLALLGYLLGDCDYKLAVQRQQKIVRGELQGIIPIGGERMGIAKVSSSQAINPPVSLHERTAGTTGGTDNSSKPGNLEPKLGEVSVPATSQQESRDGVQFQDDAEEAIEQGEGPHEPQAGDKGRYTIANYFFQKVVAVAVGIFAVAALIATLTGTVAGIALLAGASLGLLHKLTSNPSGARSKAAAKVVITKTQATGVALKVGAIIARGQVVYLWAGEGTPKENLATEGAISLAAKKPNLVRSCFTYRAEFAA